MGPIDGTHGCPQKTLAKCRSSDRPDVSENPGPARIDVFQHPGLATAWLSLGAGHWLYRPGSNFDRFWSILMPKHSQSHFETRATATGLRTLAPQLFYRWYTRGCMEKRMFSLHRGGCCQVKLEMPFFVGNPGCHPQHPFRAAGCLCVCRISSRGPFGEAGPPKMLQKSSKCIKDMSTSNQPWGRPWMA
eukprot:gene14297-biopygen14171